jgi:hypothetical protein
MFSYVVARVKPESDYQWYVFTGPKPVSLEFRGNPIVIHKGERFGVRKSSNNKEIRLVRDNDITRVLTISLDQAKKLAKQVKAE